MNQQQPLFYQPPTAQDYDAFDWTGGPVVIEFHLTTSIHCHEEMLSAIVQNHRLYELRHARPGVRFMRIIVDNAKLFTERSVPKLTHFPSYVCRFNGISHSYSIISRPPNKLVQMRSVVNWLVDLGL